MALTLRMLGGLSTPEIARAFLVPEATVAQRIVRAKKALASGVPFEIPDGDELRRGSPSVLEVVYLIFNEGYAPPRARTGCAPRCARTRCGSAACSATLAPREGEVWGLLALMEIQASRMAARVDARRPPILLLDQDRSRWDRLLIQRGLRRCAAPRGSGLGAYGAAGRDRRLPRPRAPAPRTPTGSGSPRCTRRSPQSPPRRSSSSTARSRSAWRSARPPRLSHVDGAVGRARAARLSPAAERARRPARQARPRRRGAHGARTRRDADAAMPANATCCLHERVASILGERPLHAPQ